MKKIFLLFATLFCVVFLYAQRDNPPITNEEFFTKSELVFEGYFLRYVHSYNLKGTIKLEDNYTIIAYQVKKVYKGDPALTGEVVYQVIQGAATLGIEKLSWENATISYWEPPIFRKNGIDEGVSKYSPCIFFFVTSDMPEDTNSEYSSLKKYKLLSDGFKEKFFDKMHISGKDKILGLNNLVFHKREDFYNYMRQFEGFTVPEIEPLPEQKQEVKPYNKAELDSLHNAVIKMKWGDSKKKTLKNPEKTKADTTLTLQLANQQIIYDSTQLKYYVKLDLMASTNTHLANGIYFLKIIDGNTIKNEKLILFK